jgi:hypothetical protein
MKGEVWILKTDHFDRSGETAAMQLVRICLSERPLVPKGNTYMSVATNRK